MVPTWVIFGLIFSAFSVSTLGAAFSIFGLRELFSGAAIAVAVMAASLEFAKFTLAAYLYERWKILNKILKTYLVSAVAILSMITSMGIYGFLSNAYQSASSVLEAEQLKLNGFQGQMDRAKNEIARLNHSVDEIPASRVTKRLEMRKEIEPQIAELNKTVSSVAGEIDTANLKIVEVKQKVGPLIYISKAFNVDIDNVVKYLVLVIVLVFDPLAISLVVASSESLASRRRSQPTQAQQAPAVVPQPQYVQPQPPQQQPVESVADQVQPQLSVVQPSAPNDGEVVHMRFTSSETDEKAV